MVDSNVHVTKETFIGRDKLLL